MDGYFLFAGCISLQDGWSSSVFTFSAPFFLAKPRRQYIDTALWMLIKIEIYTVVHEALNKILWILCENLIPWLLHFVSNCGNIKSWTPNFFLKNDAYGIYVVHKCQKNISENLKFTAMLLVQILPSYYSISLCLIKNLQYQQNTSDVMWLVM